MRSPAVLVLTALLLTSTALVHVAEAGPKGGPGGGGKGPHSAPGAACRRSRSPAARRRGSPRRGTSRCGAAWPGARGPDGRASRCCATYRATCCTTAATSSCRPTACFPPGAPRRRSGPRVEAPRCWPERDGRVARPQNQSSGLRRYPALLARRNERGSTPLHLHLLREGRIPPQPAD